MDIINKRQFTGSNNIAKAERLPEGAVVEAVNMDFTVGGKAELRTGFELVGSYTGLRAVFGYGDQLIVAAGSQLKRVTNQGNIDIAAIGDGPVAAVEHAGELFLNTLSDSLRIGETVRPWGISEPAFSIELVAGSFPPGVYKVAMTAMDGVESGCLAKVITLSQGQAIKVSTSDTRACRVYCSVANGQTLYLQGAAYPAMVLSVPVDDTQRLTTDGLASLPFCSMLTALQGSIFGAVGRVLYRTQPMMPHLYDPEEGYFQFAHDIELIAAVEAGLFVCAGATYFLSGFGTDGISRRKILEDGGIPGTAVSLPDGSVGWFTKYGQVIGRPDGSIEQLTKQTYSPDLAAVGAAGYLEHNGGQMLVTTMRGPTQGSRLQAGDYWDIEVIDNEA